MDHDHAGQGKIQRCPEDIRMELNRRMLNGHLGPQILPWLNGLAEVQSICRGFFHAEPVTAKNLSDYRQGAYQKWLARRADLQKQKERSEHALEVVKTSGRNLSGAAAALAAGKLLEAIERIADETTPPEDLIAAIHDLRKLDLKADEMEIKKGTLEQNERTLRLNEERTAWAVSAKILKALENRQMQAIADGDGDQNSKTRDILRIGFGDDLLRRIEASQQDKIA